MVRLAVLTYGSVHLAPEMEELKDVSRSGSLYKIFSVLLRLAKTYFWNRPIQDVIVRLLVVPDRENCSALYHAANCGHKGIVRIFLAALVFWTVKRRKELLIDGDKKRTIQEWFDKFGYPHFLRRRAFEMCVLHALDDDTRQLFTSKKFILFQLESIISGTPFQEWLDLKRKNMKPSINIGHSCRLKGRNIFEDDDIHYDEDPFGDTNPNHDEVGNEVADERGDRVTELVLNYLAVEDAYMKSIAEGVSYVYDEMDFPVLGGSEVVGENETTHADEEKDNFSWVGCSTSSAGSMTLVAKEGCSGDEDWSALSEMSCWREDTDDWSEVSKPASVMTFPAKSASYRDALASSSGPNQTRKLGSFFSVQVPSKLPQRDSSSKKRDEDVQGRVDDVPERFDDAFLFEGVKCARGGKRKLMFRGNQKHGTNYRGPWDRVCVRKPNSSSYL